MQKKILGMLICALLIATAVFPVTAIVNNTENIMEKQILTESEPQYDTTIMDDDWPTFHHDLQHTGYSTSTYAPQTSNILFKFKTNDNTNKLDPIIVDGRVYFGSADNHIYCANATTGEFIWKYYIYHPGGKSAAVANGKVYVGRTYYWQGLYFCTMICLNAITGEFIWESEYLYGDVEYIETPVVTYGKVYVNIGVNNNTLICLDADDGSKLWTIKMEEYDLNADDSFQIPAFIDGKFYFGGGTKMSCFDAETGEKFWDFTVDVAHFVSSSPAIYDGKVYFGASYSILPTKPGSGKLYCINADTGDEIWNYETGHIVACPAIAYGRIYFHEGNGYFYCLDAETGEELWNYLMIDSYGQHGVSAPAVADLKVYVNIWGTGHVLCLDAETGEEIWMYWLPEEWYPTYFHNSPAIVNGILYTGQARGQYLYAFKDVSRPPEIPTIDGPTEGKSNQKIEYAFRTIDPEGDDVKYYIDWGDGTYSGWIGLFPSGETIYWNHTWSKEGNYNITVRAQDKYNIKSRWSDPYNIVISKKSKGLESYEMILNNLQSLIKLINARLLKIILFVYNFNN
jgi:outer membrane protein assembly factor BamB